MSKPADPVQLIVNKRFWDDYAAIYDDKKASFDRYLRKRNIGVLRSVFSPGEHLLEIGCGTGTEAIQMIEYGCKLTLTDLSYGMVKTASERLDGAALVVNTPAENINCFKTLFDGGYASFGVVNCITDPKRFIAHLHRVLKPDSFFVATVINRWYWGDFLLSVLRIPNYLRKRLKGWGFIVLNGEESSATARFYSVRELSKLFRPFFSIERYYALPVILPPPYLNPKEKLSDRIFSVMESIESVAYDKFPFRLFGDQTIVVFKRVDNPEIKTV
jgi:ubiquinone/menaquinone biosynthesis C-methylase UbiE